MKNKALKITLIIVGVLLLLLAGLAAYIFSHEKEIKDYAVEQLNKQLDAKVTIDDIDITLLSQFPKVSVDLKQVSVKDPGKKTLLKAAHVFVGFNLNDILTKKYKIRILTVDSALLNIYVDKNGKANYLIFKENKSDTTTSSSNALIDLQLIRLRNVQVNYTDVKNKQEHQFLCEDVSFSGRFGQDKEVISLEGNIYATHLKSGNILLAKDKHIRLDLAMQMDLDKDQYNFTKGHIDINDLKMTLTGTIQGGKKTQMDLEFKARELSISSLLALLPVSSPLPADVSSTGDIYFSGTMKGVASATSSPAINVTFGVRNGTLTRKDVRIEHLQLKGLFGNGSAHNQKTSFITLSGLSFDVKSGSATGELHIENFLAPALKTHLKGQLGLQDLLAFTDNKMIESGQGNVKFDVNISGKVSGMNQVSSWLQNESNGNIQLDLADLKMKDADKTIRTLKADLSVVNKDLLINSFHAGIDQSDIKVTGRLQNMLPYLLADKQTLNADITYQSDYMDLKNFMIPSKSAPAGTSKQPASAIALPQYITLHAKARVQKLVYNLFHAEQVNAVVHWENKQITVEQFSCNTMNGQLNLDGQVENAPDGRFLISAKSDLKNINIQELFRQCNEFGQNEITSAHLRGKLNGKIEFVSVWSNQLDCDMNKLYAQGAVHVQSGELINYKPMLELARFVDVNELKHLKFADLQNTFEIKNKTIYLPEFEIKSNALNLTLWGTHTFENDVDYKVKLKISELIKNKRKVKPNEFGEEELPDKGMNLFLTMKGPVGDIKTEYDHVRVKQKVKQDVIKEGRTIVETFRKDMGIGKDTSIKEKRNEKTEELEFEAE